MLQISTTDKIALFTVVYMNISPGTYSTARICFSFIMQLHVFVL